MTTDEKIESFAKGQAIHRPAGWIRSYRKMMIHLVSGEMSPTEYIVYTMLLHIAGWDKKKASYGRVERNISRLHREWFPFWKSRGTLIAALKSLASKSYISEDREWITIPNFAKYQSKKGVNTLTGVRTLTLGVSRLTVSVSSLTPYPPQGRVFTASPNSKEPLKKLRKKVITIIPPTPTDENEKPLLRLEGVYSEIRRRCPPFSPNDYQAMQRAIATGLPLEDIERIIREVAAKKKDGVKGFQYFTVCIEAEAKRREAINSPIPSKEVKQDEPRPNPPSSGETIGPLWAKLRERDGNLWKVQPDTNGDTPPLQAG